MDWIVGFQKALDYIELHITEKIDYEEIAKISYSSSYHFQRVFSLLCGYTLGEYIRQRRLSLAGAELAHGKEKVIDIALKYGYDSPDSFAKAFSKFHGITPSEARRDGKMLKSFSRLSIQISLEGGQTMNYRIEEKEERIFTGYKRHFEGVPSERSQQEIDMFIETRGLQYILRGMTGQIETEYTLVGNIGDDGYDFYIAQLLPKDMRENLGKNGYLEADFAKYFENIRVPKQTYAVFETERCPYPSMEHLDLRKQIASQWLPTSGYRLADAPEIVVYHWFRKPKNKERYLELWIPIEKAE